MPIYVLKRIGMTALVVVLVLTFLGSLVHVVPGDPVRTILGPRASPEMVAQVENEMGLNDPVHTQVLDFVVGAAQGDLGRDFVNGVPVTQLIGQVLPHTGILTFAALALAVLIGLPLGVVAATRPNTPLDKVATISSVSLATVPPYVAAVLLMLLLSVHLGWLPAIGSGDFSDPVDYMLRLIMPSLSLAILWIGVFVRLTRTSMLDVLAADYVRTARAYGVPRRRVVYKLALRNAVIPVVAVMGVATGQLIGGAIFVEAIFNRVGVGRLIFDAVAARNFPIVRGGVFVVAVIFVLANLAADISYRYLDPRIRRQGAT